MEPAELAEFFERARGATVDTMNDNRVFAHDPGWVVYHLTMDEIGMIAAALKSRET